MFERDTSIYADRDALREDYQPDTLVGRDEEIDTYQSALQPVINGEQPNNIFLYGKTGVGKTASTQYLLSHLREDATRYDDLNLAVQTLNCDGLSSSYQVATQLVNGFRDEADQISTTGYPRSTVYEMLWDEIDARGGTVLVVLDEIDHVEDDSILYQLSRARATDNISEAAVGVIGISNDFSFRENLSPKVRSSLCEQEIHFPAYSASELRSILRQRAEVAFRDDILEEAVIQLCAAYGSKDAGDARQSIDLLMKAGDLARDGDAEEVTVDHVERGRRELERGRIKEGITGLTHHGHLVLYALVTFELEGETPVRSREVRPRYTRFAEMVGRDPLVPRRMRDHLSELAMLGVASVRERNEGRRGGTYHQYELDMDPGLTIEAMRETVEEVGVHRSVQDYLISADSVETADYSLPDSLTE